LEEYTLTEQTGKQPHQSCADQCHVASHELFHALRFCIEVVVAVAFQQVDGSPDAEAGTQCDDKSLKQLLRC